LGGTPLLKKHIPLTLEMSLHRWYEGWIKSFGKRLEEDTLERGE